MNSTHHVNGWRPVGHHWVRVLRRSFFPLMTVALAIGAGLALGLSGR